MSPARRKPAQPPSTTERSREAAGTAERDGAVDLDERKEKVLHTRVPQSLDRQIKQRARNLGLSVSTVVRHVLLNTFGLVEDIVTDSTNLAMSIAGEEPAAPAEKARRRSASDGDGDGEDGEIVGWQEAILNVNAVCDRCNTVLRKGTRAAIAIREQPGPRVVLCTRCLGGVANRARRQGQTSKGRRSSR